MDVSKHSSAQSNSRVAPGLTRAGVPRLDSLDLLRGLVIVLMMLDHVRDYFHESALLFSPTDPSRTK